MGYAQLDEKWTRQGCRVIAIRSVVRKVFRDEDGSPVGELLTPTEHIFLSCPHEKDVDKANEV